MIKRILSEEPGSSVLIHLNNEASQAQNSEKSDDSFKSASEGEGTGFSDSEKVQNPPSEVCSVLVENLDNRFFLVGSVRNVEIPKSRRRGGKNKSEKEKKSEGVSGDVRGKGKEVADSSPTSELVRPAICGAEHETVEESSKKIGGSGSREAAEGLVNLSSQGDEPDSSIEETLVDLLKKVGASYDPKKRKTPTPKVPSTASTKKRKAYSPTTTEISIPKGRATRSKLKQSEEEFQKVMAESKKKRMNKGKAKVHQDEHVTVDVEVQTSKPKKTKTSSKKSSFVSNVAKLSSLAKRTRSAIKAKQVKITEDEDWSDKEEGESDHEQDKMAKFGKRKILKGRLLKDLVEPGMVRLVDALAAQGWKDMVLQLDGRLARNEVNEFMANAEVKDGRVTSQVKGV
ncbi:uncharacterized protein [Nicotiana sylvestris]|uniref:uncharacterized protein n=1 Tax=Nicotiana sylvestris TaxID=4096 RepID=UPI00388C519D